MCEIFGSEKQVKSGKMTTLVRLVNVVRGGMFCRFNAEIGKPSLIQQTFRALASLSTASRQPQTIQYPALQSRFLCTQQSSSSLTSLGLANSSDVDVVSRVKSDINQGRLFAVVYISGVQHKVTSGDLILLQNHIPADVGERIRLEKILLVGGDNFTLIGQPMLSLDTVRVEATVIEKTVSEKKVHFRFRRRKRVARYRETYTPLTVLRINSIEAKLR